MLLAQTQIDERGMAQVLSSLHDILKYIEKNVTTVFKEEYEFASAAYMKLAQPWNKEGEKGCIVWDSRSFVGVCIWM